MIGKEYLLNPLEASYYFQNTQEIFKKKDKSPKEKIQLLNPFFLSLIETLTQKQNTPVFAGWFAKINFVVQVYGLSSEQEKKVQALRRTLRKSNFQKKWEASELEKDACFKIFSELIILFSEENPNDFLKELIKNTDESIILKTNSPEKIIPLIEAIFLKKQADENNIDRYWLLCDTEAYGSVRILLQNTFYSQKYSHQLIKNLKYLRNLQPIHLTDLEWFEDEKYFASTEETLLIAQPDYLVDVSIIAKSADSKGLPYLSLLGNLKFFEGNEFTFLGNMINDMLDRVVISPEIPFEEVFQITLSEKSIEALPYDISVLNRVKGELETQFETVKKVIQGYQNTKLLTEPSFISPKYGLQGRLDVLIAYEENPNRKDIIELKSAKAFPLAESPYKARQNDLIQVACYNMLIDTTYPERSGVSAILYSRDSESPLRDCGKLNFQKQVAMAYRNRMVSLDWEIAKGNRKVFDNLYNTLVKFNLPVFYLRDAKDFDDVWKKASALEQSYFVEFLAFVFRERFSAKVGGVYGNETNDGFANFWKTSLQEKQQKFQVLSDLKLVNIDLEELELTFEKTENTQVVTTFREDDIVLLYPQNEIENSTFLEQQLLQGSLNLLTGTKLKVKLWTRFVDKSFLEKYNFWTVEPNFMENSFRYLGASLFSFLEAPQEKRELILGKKEPEFDESFTVDFTHKGLSQEQNQILNKVLSAKDYFLLQGPPGTGKTSKMIRSMVDYLFNQSKETIVLLAFTNRATDEICEKISSVCQGKFIRLGNVSMDSPYREQSLKGEPDVMKLKEKLHNTRVFVSTVSSFYKFFHLIPYLDTLIVDEASQLLEPHLAGILPKFKRFILVGDEKQLPAVVTQSPTGAKTENKDLKEIGINNLSVSIFERLLLNAQEKKWDNAYTMLSTQYRTHQDIAEFISKTFYISLKAGSERQKLAWDLFDANSENPTEKWLSESRILYWNSPLENDLKIHRTEAQKVVEILKTIQAVYKRKNLTFDENTVGVITPYRAQIAEIYQYLEEDLSQKVTVDTVERYQGSERDIIIVSMAVNHVVQMQNLQSFNVLETVDKKLNVSLSRAKEQFIFLGSEVILKEGKFYRMLLEYIDQKSLDFQA